MRTVLAVLRSAIAGAAFAASAALAQVPPEPYSFGKDGVVDLPGGYEDMPGSGEILSVQLKGSGAIRFALELREAGRARNSGEAAIRALAKQKGLQARRSGKKLVVLEPRTKGEIDGRPTRSMRIDIGFGRSVAVMTLTVFEDEKDAHRVQHFFEVELEQIIASIRREGA